MILPNFRLYSLYLKLLNYIVLPSVSEANIHINKSLQKNFKDLVLNRPIDLIIFVATEDRDVMTIKVKLNIF